MINVFDIIKVEDLRELLQNRPTPVHFSYQKVNGTLREALGTLNQNLIPENKKPKESSINFGTNLRYYDLEKDAWRSLVTDCSILKLLE